MVKQKQTSKGLSYTLSPPLYLASDHTDASYFVKLTADQATLVPDMKNAPVCWQGALSGVDKTREEHLD